MSGALVRSRDHLNSNRRMILGRSLAAALAGGVPIPLLEEWLSSRIRRRTMLKIAESHQIDASDDALRELAEGARVSPEWAEVAGGALASRLLSKTWRRLFVGVIAVGRIRSAIRAYLQATLFDHYCARLHVGMGLTPADAAGIRALIDHSLDSTPGGISHHVVRRALVRTARTTARAPLKLADSATGGALRRLLTGGDDIAAASEVDEDLERQLADREGLLARATFAIEVELSASDNPYMDNLVDRFEALWRSRDN